jgi:hypothetical protein
MNEHLIIGGFLQFQAGQLENIERSGFDLL